MVARESRERTNMVNVGRDAMGQELHASKGTAGGDFGLISPRWRAGLEQLLVVFAYSQNKLVALQITDEGQSM